MNSNLPINRLINTSINLAPNAAQIQSISDMLVLGNTVVPGTFNGINVNERYRIYSSAPAVQSDLGSASPEYAAALEWFSQSPQPNRILIGRWAQTATSGLLLCGSPTLANQSYTAWTGIAAGTFKIGVNTAILTSIATGTFAGVTSMNGVAAVIQTALNGYLAGTTCIWNANYSRFEIASPTTGASSSVTFLSATGAGTDISGMMAGLSSSSGVLAVGGIAAESAQSAANTFDNLFGQSWYGLFMPTISADSDHVAVAGAVEAMTNKHFYFTGSLESAIPNLSLTADTGSGSPSIAALLYNTGYNRTAGQYSSSNINAAISLAAKALTINYNGNSTVIDNMYKQEPGIVSETLNINQISNLEAKNFNVFLAYNNNTQIIEPGNNVSGLPIDIITGVDWLALTIQTAVYNLLYLSPTKIPQTDAGNNQIVNAMEAVLAQSVANGLVAPGVWTAPGFGAIAQGDLLPKGYYVYAPPIATQLAADRSARKSVAFQIAIKLAGAIRYVNIQINVNR